MAKLSISFISPVLLILCIQSIVLVLCNIETTIPIENEIPTSTIIPSNEIENNALRPNVEVLKNNSESELALLPKFPVNAEVYLASSDESENLVLLSNKPDSEILIKEETLRNFKLKNQWQNVVLVCSSNFPIEWIYRGDGAPSRMFSNEIRTIGNFQNQSTYEYFSTIILMVERNNEALTGTYICRGIHEMHASNQIYYHLYFPGRFGFPTIRNRIIPVNSKSIVLPCMTTNPTLPMTLYKIHPKNDTKMFKDHPGISYDPKIGYTMDLNTIDNPLGTYYCSLNSFDSFWKIELVPMKDEEVEFSPEYRLVTQENFNNQTFDCKAKEKVHFEFPNSFQLGKVEFSYNNTRKFPYRASLTIESDFPISSIGLKYLQINCVSEATRRILHYWEYSSIGSEELSVTFDKLQRRILCCTKSGLSPVYEYVKCETQTDCQMKANCFENGRCEYPFPPKYTSAPYGCTGVEFPERVSTHVIKCSIGTIEKIVTVSENVHKTGIIFHNDISLPDTNEILKISTLSLKRSNEIKFKCSGSLFYFSTNFVFGIERTNGSIQYISNNDPLIEYSDTHEPILLTKMDQSIRNVICFAPLSRSEDWRNVSMSIFVTEPKYATASVSALSNSRSEISRIRRIRG